MNTPKSSLPPFASGSNAPFAEIRYSLPELLREVKKDRASASFAMEKLDQPAITKLFEQHHSRRRAFKSRK
ncbi:MAG: hypothetical protein EXS41_00295 [Opitutaceae bacterium]|nr:hypothetical protein [Opitutaceae bacterium]